MAPLHFLPELISSDASEGLLSALTLLGPILVPFASLSVLPRFVRSYYVAFPPSTPSSEIFEVLNNGALKVVVSQPQLAELEGVDRSRLVLDLELTQAASVSDSIRSLVGGVLVRSNDKADEDLSLFKTLVAAFPPSKNDVFVLGPTSAPPPTAATLKALVVQGVSPVIPTKFLTTSAASSAAQISIADAFLAPLTSDRPDGLFPTIVTSSNHSSRPLGLVYSSRESVAESINTARGVYQSRKHGLWRKGETSGSTQEVVAIRADCDSDALEFEVVQSGSGFCHLGTTRCFGSGELEGVAKLEDTLLARQKDAPVGSYTARLFGDDALLSSKIMEEAEELCEAKTPEEVAFEAADLVYFAMVRCAKAGVRWKDVEAALDKKSQKVKRRKGDAKPKWDKSAAAAAALPASTTKTPTEPSSEPPAATPAPPLPKAEVLDPASLIKMRTVPELSTLSAEERAALLLRPVLDSTSMIAKVQPIISKVRTGGDKALAELTAVYDRQPLAAEPEWSNVLLPPFAPEAMALPADLKAAIDTAYANVRKFHAAQAETEPLVVETQPGVVCSRFARPITRVGLYVPGGTAILPSSAIMLGAPAQVAGCETVVLATPPRADGTISPEVLYVASLVGVTCVVKAGGAQAVAAMAYGTETIPKVDKIFGPGNQWVTAAKMVVQNDISALVGIDMPAGPSEVLVRGLSLPRRHRDSTDVLPLPPRLLRSSPTRQRRRHSSPRISSPRPSTASTLKSSSSASTSPPPSSPRLRMPSTPRLGLSRGATLPGRLLPRASSSRSRPATRRLPSRTTMLPSTSLCRSRTLLRLSREL